MKKTFTYEIDKNDIILSVSHNWQSFAEQNDGGEELFSENLIGSSLWNFIRDRETKHLYKIILERVRSYNQSATFQFRCDSPEHRRFLELTVIPKNEKIVEFRSRIKRTESRETAKLLQYGIKRSDELVRICSMCKKVAVSAKQWKEIEEAIADLNIFEKELMPQLTHGICPSCYDNAIKELDSIDQ